MRTRLTLSILSILAFFAIQPVQAASVGDAFRETFKAGNFSYDANAQLDVSKGGDLDLPFDLQIMVNETGGKTGASLGEEGEISLLMQNISDIPSGWGDFHKITGTLGYRSSRIQPGNLNFAHITKATLSSDGVEAAKITNMLNQFAKFVTGRTFRFSSDEIVKMLNSMGSGGMMGSDEELFLSALGAGTSIDEIIAATGKLIDELVGSGVLVDTVTSRRTSTGGTFKNLETHTLSFGNHISADGAKKFQDAMMNFVGSVFPGVAGQFLMSGLQSSETMDSDLNEFLQEVGKVDFSLSFSVANEMLQSINFDVNLKAVGVPLTLSEQVTFNYSRVYEVFMPTDEKNIIDVNSIFEGFAAIEKMTSSAYDYSAQPDWDTGVDNAHPGAYDLLVNIQTACPDYTDKVCARREARNQLMWVKNQYLPRDFTALRNELKDLVNLYYY